MNDASVAPAGSRKLAFITASTDHGMMILSRMDWQQFGTAAVCGEGMEILEHGASSPGTIDVVLGVLQLRRRYHGDGVVALDGGAGFGVHTLEWARQMTDWGSVIAVEAQERVFYALAGNIAMANAFNAQASWAAIGAKSGRMDMPKVDYYQPGNLGGLRLKDNRSEAADLRHGPETTPVAVVSVDDMGLERLDFLKLTLEGMELEALEGAKKTIERCRPVILCGHSILSNEIRSNLRDLGYEQACHLGPNLIIAHKLDKIVHHLRAMSETVQETVRRVA